MKGQHALVFVLIIVGVTYLAYKNPSGMAGMFMKDSDGSALGGPVYSSQKAVLSAQKHGFQFQYGPSQQVLNPAKWRFQRGS